MTKYFVDFDEVDFSSWREVETDNIEQFIIDEVRRMYRDGTYEAPCAETHTVEYAENIGVQPGWTKEFAALCHQIRVDVSDIANDIDGGAHEL